MPWVFQPLSAAFFPVSVLPETLQWLAYALPPTYAFEAVRHGLLLHTVEWTTFGIGIVLALVYCLIGIAIFQSFFKQSRISGQFARNEA